MRKTLLLAVALMLPGIASAQWQFDSVWPDSTVKRDVHGLAVDPDGKVWYMSYYATAGDSVMVPSVGGKRISNAIWVHNADGSPASFSPILFLDFPGGVRDTVGGFTTVNANGATVWETKTGRGMKVDADGNIIAALFNDVYRIDYRTGEGIYRTRSTRTDSRGLAGPAVDMFNNVYITGVFPGDPVVILNPDLTFKENAVDVDPGFSRGFEVSVTGDTVYYAGYDKAAIYRYVRPDEFSEFDQVPDTLLRGIKAESMVRHPVTNHLWVSAGSPNDIPDETKYRRHVWYAFDQEDMTLIRDSLKWNHAGDYAWSLEQGRPRAIAFTWDGNTAYVGQFNQPSYALQKFVRVSSSIEQDPNVVPTGYVLSSNYPNPFSGTTNVEFEIPVAAHTTLKVYDVLGREVASLVDEPLAASKYTVSFDAADLPAGSYFYVLQSGSQRMTGKMTVVR